MELIINEINEKLKNIIADLEDRKSQLEHELSTVKSKIEDKISEAKSYKIEVDNAKEKISKLEEEIISLEKDLTELNERFGNKSLTAVIAAGNKEINSLILNKENEIYGYRKKINELTERARAIKDLLVNLKKDKESKTKKLEDISNVYDYYKKELDKIVDFSSANSNDLSYVEENKYNESISIDENIDDSPVFDEIESMKDDSISEVVEDEIKVEDPEEITGDIIDENDNNDTDESFNLNGVNNDDLTLFEHDKTQKIDFKTLNDSIDKEYSNIFGEALQPESAASLIDDDIVPQKAPRDLFSQNDLQEEGPSLEITEPSEDEKVVNYFTSKGIDYYSFNVDTQDILKSDFNEEKFNQLITIFDKYNIDLKNIYDSSNLFNLKDYIELENIIALLLECGQSTNNIGYVLSSLPIITAANLQEVIESYGDLIKNTNITEIILKARKLNDLPGGGM